MKDAQISFQLTKFIYNHLYLSAILLDVRKFQAMILPILLALLLLLEIIE